MGNITLQMELFIKANLMGKEISVVMESCIIQTGKFAIQVVGLIILFMDLEC